MNSLASLKYNPGILGDDELIRSFVVRQGYLSLILESLRENAASKGSIQHLLIIGPRGIGKTMLVRRLAAEVSRDGELKAAWFPIVYGEESYQVTSAGEFWLEALNHLANTMPAQSIGATLDELREERNDARLRERALAQLCDFADREGKRLLLVIENLDMLCEQISTDAQWELRHTLQNKRRIMLLGTAPSRFQAITARDQAWFEFFSVQELKPLDRAETQTLWQAIANQELKGGQARAIRILTGGNPRLLAVLAGFAAKRSFRDLMEQLVQLIDEHTAYFKSHLDGLSISERKVFVTLLEQWNPVGSADVARAARMNVNEVSSLLNRLVGRGAVEIVESRPRRNLYQASERLYNIYYLMRRRGQPADRVRAAVSFMITFYGGAQLAVTIAELAREACQLTAPERVDHFLAFEELTRHASQKVLSLVLDKTPSEFFRLEHVSEFVRSLEQKRERDALKILSEYFQAGAWPEAEMACKDHLYKFGESNLTYCMLGGTLFMQGRFSEAESSLRKALEINPDHVRSLEALALLLLRMDRGEEAEHTYMKILGLDPKNASAPAQIARIYLNMNRAADAQLWFRKAVEIDPSDIVSWSEFGHLVLETGSPEQAEKVWRDALERHPQLWDSAVNLIESRFKRGIKANTVIREAEKWINRTNRKAEVLDSMARFIVRSGLTDFLPLAEAWSREATQNDTDWSFAETLALVLAAQNKWREAVSTSAPLVGEAGRNREARRRATNFLIGAAAAGYASEALQVLIKSKGARALEPLEIGLRLHMKDTPQVAKEILEVGKDVAERILEISRQGR
jgi:tetratricopeptide (TPR) repeat protein